MKTLLVTSQITYVPGNYQSLFAELIGRVPEHLAGLVILDNLSPKLIAQTAGLAVMGCAGIASHMVRNIVELPLKRREKLFHARGLEVHSVQDMNDPSIVNWIKDRKIDLVVNVRTRCIYKKPVLEAPRLGCINIHHGLLPEYRGTLCDLYALWEGRRAGFSIHKMNEKIDAGSILVRAEVSDPGEKDYVRYLGMTGHEEGKVLAELIQKVAEAGQLPEGAPNQTPKPVYTRNPSRARIKEMRKGGMRL